MDRLLYGVLVGAVVCSSCMNGDAALAAPQQKAVKKPAVTQTAKVPADQPTPVTLKLVTVQDPVEKAYTIGMPEGWANRTYSVRVFDLHSTVNLTISPNGSVLIFAGDPSIPQYWSPQAANEMTYFFAKFNPKMRIEPFRPAEPFFEEYVKRKFGKLPGFKITATGSDEETREKLQAKFLEAGLNFRTTAARVAFSYTDGNKPMNVMIFGTCSDGGAFWIPTVCGISTTGDPLKYLPMLDAMGKSRKTNPEWKARQAQIHQEAMAQIQRFGQSLTDQHNQNMAFIQQSAVRHQQRMDAIRTQGDASTRAFNDRMASGEIQHRNFLNYINDEHTVITSAGKTLQVDNSYQRYFVHKEKRTYIGANAQMDSDSLRKLNLNPDDYEEVKVRQ